MTTPRRLEAALEPVKATIYGHDTTVPRFAADEIRRLRVENRCLADQLRILTTQPSTEKDEAQR